MTEILNDLVYIEKVNSGDTEAFGVLYERYHDPIEKYVRSRVRSREDTEDLTEETFLKALENMPTYQPIAPFSSWLYRIAHNRIIDFSRKRKHELVLRELFPVEENTLTETYEMFIPGLSLEKTELITEVQEAIASLPPKTVTLIRQYYLEELSSTQVAETLGITEGAARVRLHRAILGLRSKLTDVA